MLCFHQHSGFCVLPIFKPFCFQSTFPDIPSFYDLVSSFYLAYYTGIRNSIIFNGWISHLCHLAPLILA